MAYNVPDKDTPKPPGQIRPYPSPTSTGKVEFTVPKTGEKTTTIYRIWGKLAPESTPLVCLHGGPGMLHSKCPVGSLLSNHTHANASESSSKPHIGNS